VASRAPNTNLTRGAARYRKRMQPRLGGLALWLVVAAAAQLAALALVHRVFVGTARGQLLDTAALDGNSIGRSHIEGLVDSVLSAVTVASLVTATIAIGFIALMRGRVVLAAVATLLIVGANLTTELLSRIVVRPDYAVDVERAAAGNSLPSGHTTVAASVVVALVLVLPSRVRGLAGVVGTGYAVLVGVATLSAGWHRPSDSVAALLVVGAWAAVAGLLLVMLDRSAGHPAPPNRTATLMLGIGGVVLLAVAVVAMLVTDRALASEVELVSRGRLLTAYAGGAVGIAGATSLVMALVLATVHRVVRSRASLSRSGRQAGSVAGTRAEPAQAW
jgi:membrane-associated phospholipid phosphatase